MLLRNHADSLDAAAGTDLTQLSIRNSSGNRCSLRNGFAYLFGKGSAECLECASFQG